MTGVDLEDSQIKVRLNDEYYKNEDDDTRESNSNIEDTSDDSLISCNIVASTMAPQTSVGMGASLGSGVMFLLSAGMPWTPFGAIG